MTRSSDDTIFACATASGRAGIAVVRISGRRAGAALTALGVAAGKARTLHRALFRHPQSGELLDDGLAVRFPAPRSYTGEDVVELHLHGGRAVLDAIVSVLGEVPGLRPADAGEFTRRAFENGKLDLTEAEAVADLVAAETSTQRRQALRQLGGELGRLYEGWRDRLVRVLAHSEAEIDFPDEGLPGDLASVGRAEIRSLCEAIRRHLADNRRGERVREGLSIAILGPPNAGKSTLLNRLARREAAITSAIAGTTRDVIEVHLDLGGYAVTVADTAGLRETRDAIEAEGVRRAEARAVSADLKLVILDATLPGEAEGPVGSLIDADTIAIANKIDLAGSDDAAAWADGLGAGKAMRLSATSGSGLDALLERLTREIAARFDTSAAPTLTRARHRAALEECVSALQRYERAPLPELAAEDLRLAARALGRITGRVDVEDLLDVIFREFCIGK